MKLLIMQSSPASCHFLLLRSKYSPQHPVLKKPPSVLCCSSRSVRDQVSSPYKTTSEIMVLYILIFKFLERKREEKRFGTEWWQAFLEFNLLTLE